MFQRHGKLCLKWTKLIDGKFGSVSFLISIEQDLRAHFYEQSSILVFVFQHCSSIKKPQAYFLALSHDKPFAFTFVIYLVSAPHALSLGYTINNLVLHNIQKPVPPVRALKYLQG